MEKLECCLGIGEKIGVPFAQITWKMIGFLEEVHQKWGAESESARRTLMDQRFERPETSAIYVLTVDRPFFCTFGSTGLLRGKSGLCVAVML
jgi:hypothetical protein